MLPNENLRFEIAAAVVFRLGEELISDVIQALVELIKNSYDADASWARVSISTPNSDALPGSPEAFGEIIIEDDGHGMALDDIKRGWLMIADSHKQKMKDRGETTNIHKRTPVGDKGLGRLGVQRLGYDVEIISRATDQDTEELKLSFSWKDFETVDRLSDVPVTISTQKRSRTRSGTKIIVRNLKDPGQWIGENARQKLQKNLSKLISPFREVRDFSVTVMLNGNEVPIAEIAEQLRETAAVSYQISFDGNSFQVNGKAKLDFVTRAQKAADRELLRQLLCEDEGKAFFDYLQDKKTRGRPPLLEFEKNSKWFVSFQFSQTLADCDGCRFINDVIANPGPFKGKVDYLLLDDKDSIVHIWDNLNEYKKHVEQLAGIRVYRDGFGVKVDEDWLSLGRQQTSAGSMYGLRLHNVIGFVAISAQDNRVLSETTSREGFQTTPHYENFHRLLQQFVRWSEQTQEYLRRGVLDFLRDQRTQNAGLEIGKEIQSAADKLREHAASIDSREKTLVEAQASMKQFSLVAKKRVQEIIGNDNQLSLYYSDKLRDLDNLLREIDALVDRMQKMLDDYGPGATTIAKAQQMLDVILERDNRSQQELAMFYEGVSLGLTAETLSHEIAVITDNLAKRSSTLSTYVSLQTPRDEKVLRFVEHVKSSVSALRKQLAHLNPSLRYIRERKDVIKISDEINYIRDFYRSRFENHRIQIEVITESTFDILMNRGKLNQVLDNLLLNSEYWLREAVRQNNGFLGKIIIQIDRYMLRIWDNGNGIPLSVEDNLFDPFITTKEQGKGRGLGLFIVQQLLDTEGCSITLLPQRNDKGRRFKFEIDFKGALHS